MAKLEVMIGGNWGESCRASGYINKLAEAMNFKGLLYNGGSFEHLRAIAESANEYSVVYWFPNIDNSREKLLPLIKMRNPKCILVSSKSNPDDKYGMMALVARALQVKANLLLELTSCGGKILGTVIDPLGNCFAYKEVDINRLGAALETRTMALCGFSRVGSTRVSDAIPFTDDHSEFLGYVKRYADIFHELIHAMFQDRFLGNVSFRCERGFPSFRSGSGFYVSRRNMDKRFIGPDEFVAVNSEINNGRVEYCGDYKPSVDTPIHQVLYARYPKINYMLHSHVYVKDGIPTAHPIPCGAVEEIDEIEAVVPYDADFALVNLRGHGSLVMGSKASDFSDVPYITREIPEMMISV